ncbi:hypothetical protein RJT34_03090 [Clitoria ternatea]|uniref:RNase H type-1 domain-containing protein n=1 Tax=Clitoria ternatea TaxID=43366 RepID=A0AAN9KK63_CLITE
MASKEGRAIAWQQEFKELQVESDCLELVQLCTSQTDVSNHWLRELILHIRRLTQWEWNVSLAHISRYCNIPADVIPVLACMLMAPCVFGNIPAPTDVVPWLCNDLA